jgi:hypothetical protein
MQRVCEPKRIVMIIFGVILTACVRSPEPSEVATQPGTSPTGTITLTPSATETLSPTTTFTPTNTLTAAPTDTPSPQPTLTATPLPEGYRIVPNVVGFHFSEARRVLYGQGLTFIYRDIYDREHDFGTIIEQDPPAGNVIREDRFVILYRAFQAPGMWVGEACMPLRLQTKSGKLLFAVYLEQDESYTIQTDFVEGETTISDFRMIVLKSFKNPSADQMVFEPAWTGWYVISLGPYKTSQKKLDDHPEGVPAGCLWVLPPPE